MSVQVQAHVQIKAPLVRDHRETRRPVVVRERDHRASRPIVIHETWRNTVRPIVYSPPVYTPAPIYTSWTPAPSYTYQPAIQLLAPTSLVNDQLTINTGNLGTARTLELDAAGGETFVSQVVVYNANGSYQVLPVNQMLSASNPTIPLAVDNCAGITQIVIDGHSNWGGQLALRAL